ncbi:MAG: hypothetical protein J6L85_07535 [Clostridia bacterium]|nr:hypothetical protein [Clostridia bacterium]
MQNKNFDWLSRIEEIPSRVYVFLAIAILAIDSALCTFAHTDPAITGIVSISAYAIISLTIYLFVRRRLNLFRMESTASEAQNRSVIYSFKNQLKIPYAVVNDQGKIITVNSAFALAARATGTIYNRDINELCSIKLDSLLEYVQPDVLSHEEDIINGNIHLKDISEAEIAVLGESKYKVECYPLASKGKIYYMLVFCDITELLEINQRYRNHFTAVGYIVIDNLEEIAQYVRINYQDQTREVGKLLADWASEMGGILTEYENNKFLLIFNHEMLSECIRNKFSILSNVHKIEIGDAHIPLTISMGVATIGETLEERKHNAMVSLDMALQRGGDQVVLKTPTGIFYFGAKTKTLQKRTKGHAKIIFGKLAALIENSSNVLIMGHRNPDFDCIGACIGMATLIRNMFPEVNIKIVADTQSDNFKACTQ